MDDIPDNLFGIAITVGAILGAIGAEYLYFTNAEEVRLLFVIILLPVGAAAGALIAYLLVVGAIIAIGFSVIAAVIGAIVLVIWAVLALLYNTVLWRN